jgi:hypothetical protein
MSSQGVMIMIRRLMSSTENTTSTCSWFEDVMVEARSVVQVLACTLVVAATLTGTDLTAAELSIPTRIARGDGTVSVSIEYRARDVALAGLQFDLTSDRSVRVIAATAGSATTNSGKAVSTSVLPDGRSRFVIAGVNRNAIADGTVISLVVRVGPSSGRSRLQIVNALGADADGQAKAIGVKAGRIIRVPTRPAGR